MKHPFKKAMKIQMISSALLVFCLSIFLSLGETVAQNNSWRSSAPNPPSGLSTDEESMIANGGRSHDVDQFLLDIEVEQRNVIEGNFSSEEETSRLKMIEAARVRVLKGMTIEAAFNQAYNILEDSISTEFPSVDFGFIRDEYINQFEQ